jgi:phosphohistidine phosphatase
MLLYLVHHAEAVGADVDTRRPLSAAGQAHADRLAARVKTAGFAPAAVWHSGKLRARQTAEAFWRATNPLADFKMVRGLAPDDPPELLRDALLHETRDLLVVGHMPHLPALVALLTGSRTEFPLHGLVIVETNDDGVTWRECSRSS